jgi:hypothetical protein
MVEGFGAADVLRMKDLPVPAIGPGDLLIAVRCAGVGFAEVLSRRNGYLGVQPPFVPGMEVAGRVVKVGGAVKHLLPRPSMMYPDAQTSPSLDRLDFRLACELGQRVLRRVVSQVEDVHRCQFIVGLFREKRLDMLDLGFEPLQGSARSEQTQTPSWLFVDGHVLAADARERLVLPPGPPVSQAQPRNSWVTQRFSSQHYVFNDGQVEAFPVEFRYAWPAELDLMVVLKTR